MAFPIPSHLPRKKDARDISTQILTKVSETTLKELKASVASSWVVELEDTITVTKNRIHERISSDLPHFERQLATSISVQERLRSLTQNVDTLDQSISNHESGLVPNLLRTLTSHSALAQEVADARARHDALAHLLQCRNELKRLTRLVEEGELPDATKAGASLDALISSAPSPLQQSEVMGDLRRKCAALRNRTEEQLILAYSRSIVVSSSEVIVRPSVQMAQSTTAFPLSAIIASLSPTVLATHISTLRRDIIAHCVEYVLKQPVTIQQTSSTDISGPVEHKISLFPAPPHEEDLMFRIKRLTTVMTFLADHLFPHFPEPERKSLPLSISTPLRTAILNHLLLPHLPSSLSRLPNYLQLAKRAVQAEDDIVVKLLKDTSGERSVRTWVDGVGSHYERKRRAEILEKARVIVASPQDDSASFRVEVSLVLDDVTSPPLVEEKAVPANGEADGHHTNGTSDITVDIPEAENAWDFEDDTPVQSEGSSANGWDFEDDVEPAPEPEAEPAPEAASASQPPEPEPAPAEEPPVDEEDDPWGWNDETTAVNGDEEVVEESAWDDAWDDKPSEPAPKPPVLSVPPAAKPAKGLQKYSKSVPVSPAFPPQSPLAKTPLTPQPAMFKNPPQPPPVPIHAPVKPVEVKETFLVSGRTKELLQLVEDVLREGADLVASGILASYASGSAGNIVMQAAPMALELYRALVPVVNAANLQQSAKEPMRFSNDCRFIGQELQRIVTKLSGPKAASREKLEEGLEVLDLLADSWFDNAIAREQRAIDEMLDSARGFIDTMHQDRYDECESAVNEVLRRIRRVSPQWKSVLAKSKYYDALGAVVESAVSRILGDVLALEDITEVESHRLSELCHILNALEGLFVEDPNHPSFVVSYVPSWLKFSYLSELLEASIADISYLFEEGALVDFETEELVKLVRALFADTPLRANTINRLLQGHPVRGS
ncbi:hypothetical protein C8Q77DRAFT_1202629 [Trametes polyzona]|nr:hypothetical protein C8Q77DRAFT_1202629 [Trametes polyzona]